MNTNNLKTAVLLGAMGALVFFIVELLFGGQPGSLALALVISLAMTFASYWFSDKMAIAASRAKPVTEQEAPGYYAMMRDLTQRAGMPMPRLYVIPSDQPNAFATGRNPKHSAVAVTHGIQRVLTEDELKGVLAHELAHIKNRDILISSVAAAIAMAIMFVARMAMWGAMFGGMGGNRDDREGGGFGALLMLLLAPLAAGLIQMALSRSREYEADNDGAEMMMGGESLARALEKIEMAAKQVPMNVNPAQAQMFIVNPLTGRQVSFKNLFTTHPPTEERIRRLRNWRPGM